MEVTSAWGKHVFKAEVKNFVQAFEFIAKFNEVFTGEPCECCRKKEKGGHNVHPAVRKRGEYTFYEMSCGDCGARLAYFQRDGMFFPQRKGKDKSWLPDKGWSKYEGRQSGGVEPDLPVNEDSRDLGGEVPF